MYINQNLSQINSTPNLEPNFKARMYLKNISKEGMSFYRPLAQEFHAATKDLKGSTFTLARNKENTELKLISNSLKGTGVRIDICAGMTRQEILHSLTTGARFLKTFEEMPENSNLIAKVKDLLNNVKLTPSK